MAPIDSEQAKLTAKYFDIPNSKLRHYAKVWDVRIWHLSDLPHQADDVR